MYDPSKLFGRPGYLSLKEYIEDIEHMRKNGPWRLPLGIGDRFQLFLLKIVAKFSWFADTLHIMHTSIVSPAYATILSYIQKEHFFDFMLERNLRSRGYFSYYLEKQIMINNRPWIVRGQGVAEDRVTAFSIALGEMIERAISGFYDTNKNITVASPNMLMKKWLVLYPPKYHRFLNIQKKRFKKLFHDPETSIEWMEGKNIITNEKTYIPRQMTSWFIENRNEKTAFINATTNGAAGYFTRNGAVLRGLLEVVQRDAFLVHWLTMISPQVIKQETLPDVIQKKIQEFRTSGISLFILNTTSIPIPSVCIAAINEQAEIPQVVLCAATAVTFEEAILNALKEMLIGSEIFYYMDDDKESGEDEPEPFVSNTGKAARQLYWRGIEKVKQFSWFISGERVSYGDVCKHDIQCDINDNHQLKRCLEILMDLGNDFHPIVYFPKNIVQKKLGFYIAQVYIPKAFPFYLFEGHGTFDSDRLQEFALSKNVQEWHLNPAPHMFS